MPFYTTAPEDTYHPDNTVLVTVELHSENIIGGKFLTGSEVHTYDSDENSVQSVVWRNTYKFGSMLVIIHIDEAIASDDDFFEESIAMVHLRVECYLESLGESSSFARSMGVSDEMVDAIVAAFSGADDTGSDAGTLQYTMPPKDAAKEMLSYVSEWCPIHQTWQNDIIWKDGFVVAGCEIYCNDTGAMQIRLTDSYAYGSKLAITYDMFVQWCRDNGHAQSDFHFVPTDKQIYL